MQKSKEMDDFSVRVGLGSSLNPAGIFAKVFSSLKVNVSRPGFCCQSSNPLNSTVTCLIAKDDGKF